jgi:hypothetical protein
MTACRAISSLCLLVACSFTADAECASAAFLKMPGRAIKRTTVPDIRYGEPVQKMWRSRAAEPP